jgi:hypothetical protein
MALALLLLFFACTNEPLPIGAAVRFFQSAPCAPSEIGLDQVRKAEKNGESEFYKAMDRAQAIQVKAGDSATVITEHEGSNSKASAQNHRNGAADSPKDLQFARSSLQVITKRYGNVAKSEVDEPKNQEQTGHTVKASLTYEAGPNRFIAAFSESALYARNPEV